MQDPAGPPQLDSIRAQLKQLGYLRGPLAGFSGWLLGAAAPGSSASSGPSESGPSSFLRISALSSLRVGLTGGPLLGLAAAAAVVLANLPHVSLPRDLVVPALYLAPVFGAALAALEFSADACLGWLARRGLVLIGEVERIAGRVGFLFSVATTLYLSYLLRGGRLAARGPRQGDGLPDWLLWGTAVVGALAVGHAIGRLTRLGSLIFILRVFSLGVAGSGGHRRGRLQLAAGALVLLAAAATILAPGGRSGDSFIPASPFTPAPFPGRVIFIAVDGLAPSWYDRMKSSGGCPELALLEQQGSRYLLDARQDRVPPRFWTTVATGRPAAAHGILGFEALRVPGLSTPVQESPGDSGFGFSLKLLLPPLNPAPVPVAGGLRRARAVWEILSEGGVRSAAINWWASWPASSPPSPTAPTSAGGIVVSERAFTRLMAGARPDRDVVPETLQAALEQAFSGDMRAARSAAAASGITGDDALLERAALLDGFHALVARRLLEQEQARVLLLYLPGLDIVRSGEPGGHAGLGPAASLGHLDALIGALVAEARPEDIVLVACHPGRALPSGRERPEDGMLLIGGGRVRAGRPARRVQAVDLAPTLLALAGFPPARDLAGDGVLDFLAVGDVVFRRPGPIDTYGTRSLPAPTEAADPFDKEVLDRLRSLGYIQ